MKSSILRESVRNIIFESFETIEPHEKEKLIQIMLSGYPSNVRSAIELAEIYGLAYKLPDKQEGTKYGEFIALAVENSFYDDLYEENMKRRESGKEDVGTEFYEDFGEMTTPQKNGYTYIWLLPYPE